MDHHDLARDWAPTLGLSVPPAPSATQDEPQTGVMVAIYPSPEHATELAIADGERPEALHVTLAYLGSVGQELAAADEARLVEAVTTWAATQSRFRVRTNGLGMFHNDPPVTYASIDSPVLPAARQSLVAALGDARLGVNSEHGFTPHMTLAYADERQITVPQVSWDVREVVVEFAGHKTRITLAETPEAAYLAVVKEKSATLAQQMRSVKEGTVIVSDHLYRFDAQGGGSIQTTDRPTGQQMLSVPRTPVLEPDSAKAFVTEIEGKTLITGPATTIAAMKDPTVEDITAQHMLWMHGRFVGAETPNRNGALWSAGDLEMAKGTVVNGPLNWLHDARHVIGTLAKADYVDPRPQLKGKSGQGVQRAEGPADPHITATAAIWKWIYPDEAYVVQQASDQQMLWYSMECISKEVSCVGEGGCGNTTSYSDYMSGAACDHVRQRASVRRFVNPVFLGGAVIVPPTRPGWAEADARVMDSANALAEAAFEQAGRPDVPANDWEQLMSQLVRFATA